MDKRYRILLIITGIVLIFVIVYYVNKDRNDYRRNYEQRISELQDSLNVLNRTIQKNTLVIDSLKLKKEIVKEVIKYIEKENEKVDNWIVVSGADTNIRYLSDYLSGQTYFP